MRSSHSLDRLDTAFDDDRSVADAGLLLPATLAHHLDLKGLIESHLDLGAAVGRANVGDKVLTLVMSALAAAIASMTQPRFEPAGRQESSGSPSRLPRLSARSCAASAGAMPVSSMRSVGNCWLEPGGRGPDPELSRSRSISTRRSARRMAWPRRARSTTATPVSGAIIPSSPSPPALARCLWRVCARVGPTPSGAPPTS